MQLSYRFGLTCSLLSLLCACGGSASAPKPAAGPTVAPAPLAPLPAAPDLTPVVAPKGVVAVGRLARPYDLTKTLASWVSLPFEPSMLDALQPGLSQAVAFDAPVEFAFVLPDAGITDGVKPEVIASIGLASVEKAKTLLEEYLGQKLIERSPAVYVTPEDAKLHCAIAASVGKAGSRFVCGDKPASLDHLLPYATRGLPLENLGGADLHVEVRMEPLRQQFGAALRMGRTVAVPALMKEISLGDARFDRPLADVAHAVGDELIDLMEDVDKLVIESAASNKPEQIDLRLSVLYRGTTSFVAQATSSARARMSPPGAQFFDLPADAVGAGYVSSTDPKRLDKPRALTEALAEGLLAHFEVSAPLRREVRAMLDTLFGSSSPVVFAYGAGVTAVDKGTPSATDRLSMAFGWRIYGVEAPAAPYKDALKTLVRLNADKAFRQGLDGLASSIAKPGKGVSGKEKPQTKAAKDRLSDWVKLKSRVVAGMPTGSEVVSVEFNPEATKELMSQAKRKVRRGGKLDALDGESLRFLIAVVPDGGRTWFVFGADEKTLQERSKVVLASSKAPRLATRSDLAVLRGQSANQAGYFTLQFAKGWIQLALLEQKKSLKEAETLFSTLPHHGTTPIFYRVSVGGDDKKPNVEMSTSLPRDVFDDVAAAVPTLMILSPSD